MTVFDLLFILLVLLAVGTFFAGAVALARGRTAAAIRRLRALIVGTAAYMATVCAVALITPQRYVALGQDQCADDWCIAVTSARIDLSTRLATTVIGFRVSSRALRVDQRERGVVVTVVGASGARYAPVSAAGAPFDTLLHPGDRVVAERRFELPPNDYAIGVIVGRSGVFPGCCIIGDAGSLLHKRPIVRVPGREAVR